MTAVFNIVGVGAHELSSVRSTPMLVRFEFFEPFV